MFTEWYIRWTFYRYMIIHTYNFVKYLYVTIKFFLNLFYFKAFSRRRRGTALAVDEASCFKIWLLIRLFAALKATFRLGGGRPLLALCATFPAKREKLTCNSCFPLGVDSPVRGNVAQRQKGCRRGWADVSAIADEWGGTIKNKPLNHR